MSPLNELSVIIPVGAGEQCWRELLDDLQDLPEHAQILLVAADSSDVPLEADGAPAPRAEVRWLVATTGRANQLNAGAAAAQRHWLWFLHADSRLSARSLAGLADAVQRSDSERQLGYFDLRFLADGPPLMWLNSIGVWFRSRVWRLPFGDQGLFLSRALFEQLGRFDPALPFGEDHALVWRAHAAGVAVRSAGAVLFTSARKYAERGWLNTTRKHLRLTWQQARAERRAIRLRRA